MVKIIIVNNKKSIYKNAENLSAKDMRKLRNKNRNILESFCVSFIEDYTKNKKVSTENLKSFKDWYKETFLINDYSKESFSQVGEKSNNYQLIDTFYTILQISL